MIQHRRRIAAAAALACSTLLLAAMCGCGGPSFGSELSGRPSTAPLASTESRPLKLPADAKFTIRHHESRQVAEFEGQAQADAHAAPTGEARATASVTDGGVAEGTFQLGHAFHNDGPRQIDLSLRVRLDYEYEASADPRTGLPDAAVGLNLYARDGRNRLIKTVPLVTHSTEQGDASSRGHEDFRFSATLGPGESLSVFVAGNARVQTKAGRSARVAVRMSGLELEIQTRAAPAVRAGGDG
jgi:hypothetical protein